MVVLVLAIIEKRSKRIALVVHRWTPKYYNNNEDKAEEYVPKRSIHPSKNKHSTLKFKNLSRFKLPITNSFEVKLKFKT